MPLRASSADGVDYCAVEHFSRALRHALDTNADTIPFSGWTLWDDSLSLIPYRFCARNSGSSRVLRILQRALPDITARALDGLLCHHLLCQQKRNARALRLLVTLVGTRAARRFLTVRAPFHTCCCRARCAVFWDNARTRDSGSMICCMYVLLVFCRVAVVACAPPCARHFQVRLDGGRDPWSRVRCAGIA